MKIIAFDLGKNMSYADNYRGIRAAHKVFDGLRAERFAATMRWLLDIEWSRFDACIYETPFARGPDATRCGWGVAGLIEACAANSNLPVMDAAVSTIKKFATGHGKACKEDMIAAAQRMGYTGTNEHEADAVCLLHYGIANMERVKP